MNKLKRNRLFIGSMIVFTLFFSVSVFRSFDNSGVNETEFELLIETNPEHREEEIEMKVTKIIVDLKGAVKEPGIYEMELGDRVFDVINKASGLHENANENLINLAQLLQDEMVVYVPFEGEEENQQMLVMHSASNIQVEGKININKATITDLQAIPGIGPQKAASIVAFREENGQFKTVDDLAQVSGIGKKTLEKMRGFIIVN